MRVGSICWATDQGLGHLMKWFYDAGVITDPMILVHPGPGRRTHTEWYPPMTPVLESRRFNAGTMTDLLRGIDVMLFFETPFDWSVLGMCRKLGVKTALVPMYEWTPVKPPDWFDLVIAPSLLDQDYFKGSIFLQVPVPEAARKAWRHRDTARRFLHNAGNIGHREHKGTRQVLEAARLVKSPVELVVRAQDSAAFRGMVVDVFGQRAVDEISFSRNGCGYKTIDPVDQDRNISPDRPRLGLGFGSLPHDAIWDDADVLVQPEKFNGLSLPLMEARAAGMLVMTTDRYPANTWLPTNIGVPNGQYVGDDGLGIPYFLRMNPLIPVSTYQKAGVSSTCYEFDEAVVRPEDIAAKIDEWYGRDIGAYSESGREWAEENSWAALKPKWLEVLASCL